MQQQATQGNSPVSSSIANYNFDDLNYKADL